MDCHKDSSTAVETAVVRRAVFAHVLRQGATTFAGFFHTFRLPAQCKLQVAAVLMKPPNSPRSAPDTCARVDERYAARRLFRDRPLSRRWHPYVPYSVQSQDILSMTQALDMCNFVSRLWMEVGVFAAYDTSVSALEVGSGRDMAASIWAHRTPGPRFAIYMFRCYRMQQAQNV